MDLNQEGHWSHRHMTEATTLSQKRIVHPSCTTFAKYLQLPFLNRDVGCRPSTSTGVFWRNILRLLQGHLLPLGSLCSSRVLDHRSHWSGGSHLGNRDFLYLVCVVDFRLISGGSFQCPYVPM